MSSRRMREWPRRFLQSRVEVTPRTNEGHMGCECASLGIGESAVDHEYRG